MGGRTLTKKNYEAFAEIFFIAKLNNYSLDQLQDRIERYFYQDNTRFDALRFEKAVREGGWIR